MGRPPAVTVPLALPKRPQQQLLPPLGKTGKIWRGLQVLWKAVAGMSMETVVTGPLTSWAGLCFDHVQHCPSPGHGEVTTQPIPQACWQRQKRLTLFSCLIIFFSFFRLENTQNLELLSLSLRDLGAGPRSPELCALVALGVPQP